MTNNNTVGKESTSEGYELPLLYKQGSDWYAKPFAGILIKSGCPTPEAQQRFLNKDRNRSILSSHASKNQWNSQKPYIYREKDGEWRFYFAGKGTYQGRSVNLWDIYFIPTDELGTS